MTLPADVYHGRPAADVPDPHVKVVFGDRDTTCDMVDALSISGGRSDKMAQADPATAAMTLRWDPADPMPQLGDEVRVVGWSPAEPRLTGSLNGGVPLFHGEITDLAVEGLMVSVAAAEPTRWLDAAFLGDTPWPEETLRDRIERLARLTATELGVRWIPDPLLRLVHTAQQWANHPCAPRDVDHRRAKELFEQALSAGLGSLYYKMPKWVDPADDATFTGELAVAGGIASNQDYLQGIPTQGVPCLMIDGDPGPRFWRNLTTVINSWNVRGWTYDASKSEWREASGTQADDASKFAYGARAGSIDTPLNNTAGHTLTSRAADLLAVTKTAHWCVDNIVCYATAATFNNTHRLQHRQTMQLAGSPSEHARFVYMDLFATGNEGVTGMPLVVIESKQVDWRPDGWQITFAVSHPLMYDVAFTGLGPDPTGRPITGPRLATLLDLHNYEPTTLQALADRPSNTLAELDRDVNAWLP